MKPTTKPALRILIVEDNPDDADLMLHALRGGGWELQWVRVETECDFLSELKNRPDIILSDHCLPAFSGLRALELLRASGLDIPLILISGAMGEEVAVEAMRRGATDFLLKDHQALRLRNAVQRALEEKQLRTERAHAEVKIQRLNRLYAVSSSVNEAIVRIRETPALYEQACRIAVERGGLAMAWIGLVEANGRALRPAARWGRDDGYLEAVEVLATAHQREGQGPAGQAFRTGAPVCCNDIENDAAFASQAEALARGYRSCVAFPLKEEGRSHGVLVVYGDQPGYFEAEDLQLLNALAENISFAVEANQREASRQRAEQALRASEASLATAQAVAKIGSWETDIATLAITWSAETYRIFEISPAAFQPTYEKFLQFVHPEDRETVNTVFLQSWNAKSPSSIEHRLLLPDGQIKIVHERWQMFFDASGHPVRAVGTCQDVTESRRAETEARRTTELLRAVAEGTSDAVFVKDLQGRYLFFNEAAARFVGLPVEEVLGKDDTALFDLESARIAQESGRRVVESGEVRTTEEVLTAGGITRTFMATKAPYRDNLGKIIGVIGISRDITERKRNEARFRWLVESNVQGVFFWTADGRVTDANDAFLRMTGYTREDVAAGAVNFLAMTPPEWAEVDRRAFEQLNLRRVCEPFEKEYRCRDGTRIPVLIGAAYPEDNPHEGVAFVLDLTERKKLEQQYLRAQRLESVGALASGLAHDLNNTLAPILMCAPLLRGAIPPERAEAIISTIERSGERAANIVKQVLSFSRGAETERRAVPIQHLLAEMVDIARSTFSKTIAVAESHAPDLWPVTADATQLHQVLMNLCVNARDAMPHGGTLTISARNAEVDESFATMIPEARPGSYVLLETSDTGNGIAPALLERIFEPFFTTKPEGRGTGLGLASVAGIVKSHGGFVRVQSELGRGTTFQVYLPATLEEVPGRVAAAQAPAPYGQGECILVVDDEASVRAMAALVLETHGYKVMAASDGTEAISLYAQHGASIAAVLTDVSMPFMDGIALVRALQRLNPAVKVLVSSGQVEQSRLAELRALTTTTLLHKPYLAHTLLTELHGLLSAVAGQSAPR